MELKETPLMQAYFQLHLLIYFPSGQNKGILFKFLYDNVLFKSYFRNIKKNHTHYQY